MENPSLTQQMSADAIKAHAAFKKTATDVNRIIGLFDACLSVIAELSAFCSSSALSQSLHVPYGAFVFFDRDLVSGRRFTNRERGRIAQDMLRSTAFDRLCKEVVDLRETAEVVCAFSGAPADVPLAVRLAGDQLANRCGIVLVFCDAVLDLFGKVMAAAASPDYDPDAWVERVQELADVLPSFRNEVLAARLFARVYLRLEACFRSGKDMRAYYPALLARKEAAEARDKEDDIAPGTPSYSDAAYRSVFRVVSDFARRNGTTPQLEKFLYDGARMPAADPQA